MRSPTIEAGWTALGFFIIALYALLLTACAPAGRTAGYDTFMGGAGPDCWTLDVRNDRFERMVVYHAPTQRRIAEQGGKTQATHEVCGLSPAEATFRVNFIGAPEERVRSQGPSPLHPGDHVWIHARIRGRVLAWHGSEDGRAAGFGGPLEDFYVIGARRVPSPYATWVGIYLDVQSCLGQPVGKPTVEWYVADYLVDMESGLLTYGVTEFTDGGEARAVYIDKNYVFHATVVSHEAVHVMTGMKEPGRCVMHVPGGLGERPIPDEVMERVRG